MQNIYDYDGITMIILIIIMLNIGYIDSILNNYINKLQYHDNYIFKIVCNTDKMQHVYRIYYIFK